MMQHFARCFLPIVVLLTACAPAAPAAPIETINPPTAAPTVESATIAPTETPPATQPPTETLSSSSDRVDVGGHKLFYACVGEGSPTVILEAGAGGVGDWARIIMQVKKVTRICFYDRANNGGSDRVTGPRTSQDVVDDLHALLINAAIEPPYILAGWSLGGWFVRLYAHQFPEEVVGLLFIDGSHPDQFSAFLAVLPEPAPDEPQMITNERDFLTNLSDWEHMWEQLDLAVSADQVRGSGPFGDLPLIVLSQDPDAGGGVLPADIDAKWDQSWQELQVDLAQLSTNSTHIVVQGAGHDIPHQKPQAVIDALLALIATGRDE